MAFSFVIIRSIAATGRKFMEYLPIKTRTKFTNFYRVSKMIQPKIEKISKSVYVIIERNKLMYPLDLRSVLP